MERPFSYTIYQQGKKLYQNMKVSNLSVNGKTVEGRVMDHKLHKVKLVFNEAKQLSAKYCDCTYAKVYHECPHSAALFIRYMNEGTQEPRKETLRTLYNVYISSKSKPNLKDYQEFESRLLNRLVVLSKEGSWETIKEYCEEIPRITYPINRIHFLVHHMIRSLNTLIKDEKFYDLIFQWGIDSLSWNKNIYFHPYFLNLIQKKEASEVQQICDNLLMQMPLVLNEALCSRILMILSEKSQLGYKEFRQKYDQFKNSEAMVYLEAVDLVNGKDYSSAMKLIQSYQKTHKNMALAKEMKALYEKAWIQCDPSGYVSQLVQRLSYWNPDFSEIIRAKELLKDKWKYISQDIYDKVRKKTDGYSFEQFINEQQEWEYVVHLLYREPTLDNIEVYGKMIQERDEELYAQVLLEALINTADKSRSTKAYEMIIDYLEEYRYRYQDNKRVEYMIYYLKKLNPTKNKLIELLDDVMGEMYGTSD